MTWREFWNADTPIYVNARHKQAHYARIAQDILDLKPGAGARVLDFGSGEATSAGRIAAAVDHLYLVDGAELVRRRVAETLKGRGNVTVLSPEEMGAIAPGSLDLVVVNSVLQYLGAEERDRLLANFRHILKPGGRLHVADVVPPDTGAVADVIALLRFARSEGFLIAALAGLVRTFFSDYRRKRSQIGLSHYSEAEMLAILQRAGFAASRVRPNMGHNQTRMAFSAMPAR